MDRYSTHQTLGSNETFLLDDGKDGETVAVFTRKTHAADAARVASLMNEDEADRAFLTPLESDTT